MCEGAEAEGGEEEMKLREVLERAGELDAAERLRLWEACGEHDLKALPTTETGGGTPPRYCSKCWTAFSYSGAVMNPLKFPETDEP